VLNYGARGAWLNYGARSAWLDCGAGSARTHERAHGVAAAHQRARQMAPREPGGACD
jgi:hypothetical protein